jgi:hypothetical protein
MRQKYLDQLRQHVRPIGDIEEDCDRMDEVPRSIFDEHVECLESFCEEDYRGSSYALYEFAGKYFVLEECFGSCSGCDGWMDASTDDHENTIHRIIDNIQPCEHLWEIPVILQYVHPTWRWKILSVMEHHGCLDAFHKHQIQLEEERVEQEQEADRKRAAAEQQKRRAERERQEHKRQEEDEECKTSLAELVTYFEEHAERDPFFESKRAAKMRQLRYFCDKLPEDAEIEYQDLKKRGLGILDATRTRPG